jgi:hypothetical protein
MTIERLPSYLMSLTSSLDQLTLDLDSDQQQALHAGEVVMLGSEGTYTVLSSLVPAPVFSCVGCIDQLRAFSRLFAVCGR